MTNPRDKTLKDFTEVLRWVDQHELDVTVIGGLAVGAFAASQGISLFSGDLDLLVTPQEQARFTRLAETDPRVEVAKRVEPRSLRVLVLRWGELEVDVLTNSDGLPSPDDARARAWTVQGMQIADPVDLLCIKLSMMREKDVPHIAILREVCDGFAHSFFRSRNGRDAIEFLERWAQAERWETLPVELFESLLKISTDSSPAGRKYLARRAPSRAYADNVVAAAPESERAQLCSIATACHP
ncbi:MAG: hypothetical protein KUG77_08390 [Nannocystaceae bacterium]|nr:hypothetical protein [Nannocystaceae bacterium]